MGVDTSGGSCTEAGAPISLVIENKGTTTAFVTVGGNPFFSLHSKEAEGICIFGGSPGQV